MRGIRIAAAVMAGVIVASGAGADEFTLTVEGTFDLKFNTFLPPHDGFNVGDSWKLQISYDTDVPFGGTNPNALDFKDSLCYLGLTLTTADMSKTVSFVNHGSQMDFDGDCDLVVTTNPCGCGDDNGIDVLVDSLAGFGFNFTVIDGMGNSLPFLQLPTNQMQLDGLAGNVQFEFFAPGLGGSTARLVSMGADAMTITDGCVVPVPATGALLGAAGLLAVRRRR